MLAGGSAVKDSAHQKGGRFKRQNHGMAAWPQNGLILLSVFKAHNACDDKVAHGTELRRCSKDATSSPALLLCILCSLPQRRRTMVLPVGPP
jgi:hypothetical protein